MRPSPALRPGAGLNSAQAEVDAQQSDHGVWQLQGRQSTVLCKVRDERLPTSSGRRGRLIGSLGFILPVLGRGTGPGGEKMAAACPGVDSQDLAMILDPFRAIFADLGPDRLSAT